MSRTRSRKRLRAAIFDRDGVLTRFDLGAAMAALRPLLPLTPEELVPRWQRYGQVAGFPRDLAAEAGFWRGFWDQVCDDLALDAATRAELHVFDYTAAVRPFPDARPAIEQARRHGLRIGVLSNFSLASLDRSLAAYGAVLRALGVQPDEALFFDDEEPCVAGARAIGLEAFLVDRRLMQHDRAHGVIRSLADLESLLS